MKAYLKPEDEQELLRMVKSLDLVLTLWGFDQWLRGQIKYHDRDDLEETRYKLYELMAEYDINPDKLIS